MLLTLKIGWLDRLVLPSITLLVVLRVALTELRNVCAHHVRLWNRCFMKSPRLVKKLTVRGFEEFLPIESSNKLYIFAVLLAAMLKADNPKTTWPTRLGSVINKKAEPTRSYGLPG